MYRLNTKKRLTMLCLSAFELYSGWVPLETECHIINNLLTELARAVLGNIGPRPRANIPQYGPSKLG